MNTTRGADRVLRATVILALSIPGLAFGEWERQRMSPQEEDKGFLDVCALSSSFAVAVGVIKQSSQDAAAVFITRDGTSWAASSPRTSGGPMDVHMYLSVWFADESHGYVGGLGEIWTTDDGGATWVRTGLGGIMGGRAITDITGLRPAGPAWAAASTGQVLRTTDGGATWPELAVPLSGAGLNSVVFIDEEHGWVISGRAVTDEGTGAEVGFEQGGLAVTTDGGATWQVVFSGETRMVSSVRFVDASRGWMLSRDLAGSRFERTTDGGLTWQPVAVPAESSGGAVGGLSDVFFFDPCEGMLIGSVGDNDWGAVWHTVDGGETWVEVDRGFLRLGQIMGFPIEAGLLTFDFADRDVGWATGTYESIFRYDSDDDPPACDSGGGDGDGGGGGGGRCGCRAPGSGPAIPPVFVIGVTLAGAVRLSRAVIRERERERERGRT